MSELFIYMLLGFLILCASSASVTNKLLASIVIFRS